MLAFACSRWDRLPDRGPHDAFDVIMPMTGCCVAGGLELGSVTFPIGFGVSCLAGGERQPTHPRPCLHALRLSSFLGLTVTLHD